MTSIFHHPYCKPFIRHPIESIKCFFISLKWVYQRVKKGYCDQDLIYGVENWLLEMLPEVVDEINKENRGVPGMIHMETIESFGINPDEYWDVCNEGLRKRYSKEIDAEAEKRWYDILSRISFLLRETVDWKCTKTNPLEEEYFLASEKRRNKIDVPKFDELQKDILKKQISLMSIANSAKRKLSNS